VKNWPPGGPADETVCPTFLAVQRFANWVGQAVSPAGPIFHTFSALTLGAMWKPPNTAISFRLRLAAMWGRLQPARDFSPAGEACMNPEAGGQY